MPTFTTDWFSRNKDTWDALLAPLRGQPVSALEVGSWEGRSALYLLEHVLTHPSATLTCIDTWEGSTEHTPEQIQGIYERFMDNTRGHHAHCPQTIQGCTEVARR